MNRPKGFPQTLTVCGLIYRVEYVRHEVEADIDKRAAVWGQVDFHTRSIRICVGRGKRRRKPSDLLNTLLHELLHAILQQNKAVILAAKADDTYSEVFVDSLASVLTDTLVRNGLVRRGGERKET